LTVYNTQRLERDAMNNEKAIKLLLPQTNYTYIKVRGPYVLSSTEQAQGT